MPGPATMKIIEINAGIIAAKSGVAFVTAVMIPTYPKNANEIKEVNLVKSPHKRELPRISIIHAIEKEAMLKP